MPKNEVDYSNTIIYKIYCKDESLKDIYVGHTTNFIQRKYSHKIDSNDLKKKLKIYETIRNNGGWSNWDMIEIAKYSCKDVTEARIKEQYHYNELKASLNSYPPYVDVNKYFCLPCKIQCYSPSQYKKHIVCRKHKTPTFEDNTLENDVNIKSSDKHVCEICHFSTSRCSQYNRHIDTDKHKNNENLTFCQQISTNVNNLGSKFVCDCGKNYKERSGLWRHKKKCSDTKDITSIKEKAKSITDKDELIMFLIKECSDYKNILIEQQDIMLKVIENGFGNNSNDNLRRR